MSDQGSSSASQSSDGGEKGPLPITFNMHRGSLNPEKRMGYFHLEMPSDGMPKSKTDHYPPLLLELKDEDQMDCLMRMKHLHHENILAVHFFDEHGVGDARCIRAFVEPYTGCILELFDDVEFFVEPETQLVPSEPFRDFVSSSLSGLDHIIKSGLYHGNFSWDTTVYKKEKDGRDILKLANFEKKNKNPLQCQVGDCHALAQSLEEVSRRVRREYVGFRPTTCCLLDDLARRLRGITIASLGTIQEIQDDVFFWDDMRKRTFCSFELPAVWFKPAFLQRFLGSLSAPAMPWDTLWTSNALMDAMKRYRVNNNIPPYNFHDITDFLRFISGLYTHLVELEEKVQNLSVNVCVHLIHPRLLLDLKAAMEEDAMEVEN